MTAKPREARKRVLVVSENGLYPDVLGGMELRGRELVDWLTGRCDVAVLTNHEYRGTDGRPKKVHLTQPAPALEWVRHHVSWAVGTTAFHVAVRRDIRSMLRAVEPDVIWFHKFGNIHPAAFDELLRWGAPTFLWIGDRWSGRVIEDSYGALHRLRDLHAIFNCDFLRRFYQPLLPNRAAMTVVHDGVDTSRFSPGEQRGAGGRVAFCGRATREKGFLTFCRLMAAMPPDAVETIDVIGDGPALAEGLEILRSAGRIGRLRHAGAVSFGSVHQQLRAASILVLPSTDEGFPGAVLEAMACGLTVIATDVGGTNEAVRTGETGMLVAPDDFDALRRCCEQAASDPQLRTRLGAAARRRVLNEFTLERKLCRIGELIESAGTSSKSGLGRTAGAPERAIPVTSSSSCA